MEKLSKKANVLQAIKFACFSASAGVIQVTTFTLLNELMPEIQGTNAFSKWFFNSEYGAYYLIALVLSVIWNFTFNRKFTFKSATNIPVAMLKVFGFYCVFTPVSVILGEMVAQNTSWDFAEYIIFGSFSAAFLSSMSGSLIQSGGSAIFFVIFGLALDKAHIKAKLTT